MLAGGAGAAEGGLGVAVPSAIDSDTADWRTLLLGRIGFGEDSRRTLSRDVRQRLLEKTIDEDAGRSRVLLVRRRRRSI